jgi:outer membrane protein assembly factor BamB
MITRGGWRLLFAPVVASFLVACAQDVAPAPSVVASATPISQVDIAVLPNNTVVHCSRNKLVALREGGEILWELVLPDDDSAIAPLAVALNSITYVRGMKSVHAATPDGKWLWSKPLDGQAYGKSRLTNAPVALSDSTVGLVIADDVVRYDVNGAVRWRVTIPEGHANNRLISGMDGSIIVPTTGGLYSINPEGSVAWRRVLER